MKKNNDIPW